MFENIVEATCLMTIKKFFDGKGKTETDLISIGLAVGYYYNFLEPLSAEIERDDFTVSQTRGDGAGSVFMAEDVQVRIPMNSDTHSDPYQTVIPIQFGHFSERSDATVGLLVGKAGPVKVS